VSDRTSGELPVEPFGHIAPTGVAEVSLDGPLRLSPPGDLPWPEGARDTLALVRLHGEPLDLIHIPSPPGGCELRPLAEEVWAKAGAAIRRHACLHGCGPAPSRPEALIDGWPGAGLCPGAQPGNPGLSVAVVIATSRGGAPLARCLRSLERLDQPNLEVVVVGRESSAPDARSIVAAAAERLPGLRYIRLERGGTSIARNLGIISTSADIVAITDDDVVVDPRWIDWLTTAFARPEVAAVTGLVLPLELQTPAQKWFELYAGCSKGLSRRAYDNDLHKAHRLLYPYWGAVYGAGNNVAFRRQEFTALGGFDPALGGGTPALTGEDTDAMSRIVRAGWTLLYEPRALVWHEHRRDEAALRRQLFAYGLGFTAALTKAALHDPRFHAAALRSLPILAKALVLRRRQAADHSRPRLPAELSQLELRGMVAGPRAYLRSAAVARKHSISFPSSMPK
jgi:GT2 family glycosyltransferase